MDLWNRFDRYMKRKGLRYLERCFARPLREPGKAVPRHVRRLLVIRSHDQLGDFLLSTPALTALRRRFPRAWIGIVVRSYCADAVAHHRAIDEVIVFREYGPDWTLTSILRFWKALGSRWDMAVVLSSESHSLTSDLFAVLSGARLILGSESHVFPGCSRNFFYDLAAPDPGPVHQTERNMAVVRTIGADTDDLSETVFITEEEKEEARREYPSVYSEELPVIGFHIGGSKPDNRWPVDRFVHVAEKLRLLPARILVFWGPGEDSLSLSFRERAGFQVTLIPPSTLRRLAVHFSLCDMVVCNDTGTMHLCAAVGTPLVAVFGPTDPAEWKPEGDRFRAVRGKDHRTASVTVNDVLKAATKLFRELQTSKPERQAP